MLLTDDLHTVDEMCAVLTSTAAPFRRAHYEPHELLWHQGDPCAVVSFIVSGLVQLAVTSRDGQEAICGLLGAGSFLGEEALLPGDAAAYRHTVAAMTATQVIVVPKAQMRRLLATQSVLSERLLAHLLARHSRLEADLADQLTHSAEQRLARVLLLLAGCDARQPCRCALPHVSQAALAEMIGTTRSRVNVFMGRFKRMGFLSADGATLWPRQPARRDHELV